MGRDHAARYATGSRLRRLAGYRVRFRRLGRYLATSAVATVVSEAALLGLYGAGLLGAAPAAAVANLAGTVPSYAMSRYWIWPDADRSRPGRQAGVYWTISLVSLAASTAVTGVVGANAPAGHTLRMVVVGLAYVATYGVLWIGKFVVYQWLVFQVRPVGLVEEETARPVSLPDDGRGHGHGSLPRSA